MPRLISKKTIKSIRRLRSKGWSLPEIHRKVKIGYGSVFRYIKDVEILPKYQSFWKGKRGGSKKRMLLAEKNAEAKAVRSITSLSKKEKLIIAACLYWAEGNKKDFNFTNTDSEMIAVFIDTLQTLGIPKSKLRVTIRVYEDLDKEKCINYWSGLIGIPTHQIINVNVLRGKKVGKLTFGMCRIRITKGGDMLKYLNAARNRIISILSRESQ